MPRLNLADADANFDGGQVNPIVADGIYGAVVKDSKFEIDDKGREKIVVDFRVTEEGDSKDLVFRSWNYLHTPDCQRITVENLSNVGVPPNWHYKNTSVLVGKECRIELAQGDGYMNVKSIRQRFIPNGTYTCVVDEVGKQDKSYTRGTPFRRVFFKIVDEGSDVYGLKIVERLFLNDKALGVTASKLKSIGAELAEFDTESDRDWGCLKGLRVKITYANTRSSDGKEYGRVTKYDALGRGTATAASTPTASVTPSSTPAASATPPTVTDAEASTGTVEVGAGEVAGVEEEEDEIPF